MRLLGVCGVFVNVSVCICVCVCSNENETERNEERNGTTEQTCCRVAYTNSMTLIYRRTTNKQRRHTHAALTTLVECARVCVVTHVSVCLCWICAFSCCRDAHTSNMALIGRHTHDCLCSHARVCVCARLCLTSVALCACVVVVA